jgi:rubrerythrin
MSFLKKFKDRVTSPKARISLQLNKSSFVLGENAEVTLAVSSDEEFDSKEIRCEIQCVEEAKRVKYVYDSVVNRNVLREVQESATLYSSKPSASGPLHISQGFSQAFPLNISIPAGGRPTFQSIDSRVSWSVKGVIAIEGRPDVASSAMEIQVSQGAAAQVIKEKEIIREVVMIPCKYCGALMPQTDTVCPNCGAKRTG